MAKYCHSVLARVSRGWSVFAKVDKTILQNVELPFNANQKDDTESEVCACANTNANTPRHICESKLRRGDFLVRVDEYLKKSVRVKIEVNPQPSYAHFAWLLPIHESSRFASQKHSALWQQSALPSLGEGKTSHADTKGMARFVSVNYKFTIL